MVRAYLVYPPACLTLALMLAAGCHFPNPAFGSEDGEDGTVEDTDDGSSESTTTTTATTDPITTDDPPGDGDGDGSTEPSDTDDPITEDFPDGTCYVDTTPGLFPLVGRPEVFEGSECPPELGFWVRVQAQNAGDWVVIPCPMGCGSCNDQGLEFLVGAQSLALADLIPPELLVEDQPWVGCYYIQATPLLFQEPGGCYFGALSVHTDEGPTSPLLFAAVRESWDLTPSGLEATADYQATPVDDIESEMCLCEDLDIDCCAGQEVSAMKFKMGPDDYVYPGEDGLVQVNDGLEFVDFTFYGEQAQRGTHCEAEPEISWALYAN